MKSWRLLIVAAVGCLIAAAAVPALADNPIPAEWIGVWQLDISFYACGVSDPIFSTTELDTICAGTMIEDPQPDGITVSCTYSADATSYTSHCEGSTEVEPGCTENFVEDTAASRTGETYTAVTTTEVTYTGSCSAPEDFCSRTEFAGTRISDGAAACAGTPNENSSWGALKSSYR